MARRAPYTLADETRIPPGDGPGDHRASRRPGITRCLRVRRHAFSYRCLEPVGEYRSSYQSRLTSEAGLGFVEYEVGLQCRVNGKRGHRWTLIVAYEPNDTYAVWLVEGRWGRNAGFSKAVGGSGVRAG